MRKDYDAHWGNFNIGGSRVDARFQQARVFPCSSMLIMRPMRSRGNEVMCVCVVPSVTMSLAVVCKRASWCLLGLLPSQLSTTLREHGENLCFPSLGYLDCRANENAKCIFEPARGFQIVYALRIDQTWQFVHNPSSPYVSVFLLLSLILFFHFWRGGRGVNVCFFVSRDNKKWCPPSAVIIHRGQNAQFGRFI